MILDPGSTSKLIPRPIRDPHQNSFGNRIHIKMNLDPGSASK